MVAIEHVLARAGQLVIAAEAPVVVVATPAQNIATSISRKLGSRTARPVLKSKVVPSAAMY